jgi:hypothetical protein
MKLMLIAVVVVLIVSFIAFVVEIHDAIRR